ncbi:hypothetical protein CK203_042498 [Vitis vinifera]|uniref:Endonuclease/exonuclease/phosphatase domain-containing protein n=1 Tax=Vitis vinifera TaxID=29760 RepID=A0A438HEZ8_VITVI|nr:hypothetical protein CK203_042498 [Vitis vinifera]
MKIKILSWNIRELNDEEKRKLIKSVVRTQKVDLVCLLETKVQEMELQVDNRVLDLLQLECGGFSISCHFRNVEDDFVWVFTGVYDIVLMREKKDFWDELGAIKDMRRFLDVIKELSLKTFLFLEDSKKRECPLSLEEEIWLRDGDKNTKFFHKMANAHARRNLLTKVRKNGVTLIDDEEIKARVCNAYHTLLLETGDWRPSVRVYALKCWGKIDPKV